MLHGALAAAVTPLKDGGRALDEAVIRPMVEFLAAGGVAGILVCGTTGEGILLSKEERKRTTEAFLEVAPPGLQVAIHCGAQTTAETVALSEHAARSGAAAVAVIGPPYYAYDEPALLVHFAAAARACAPLPFYLYEFAARAGYSIPLSLIPRLREAAPNVVGLKVSNQPWEKFAPFLLPGFDVFVGPEALIARGLAAGAKGAVSGLAAAFPEAVAGHVARPTPEESERIAALRASLQDGIPFNAAIKTVLALRGVPIREEVRGPLRGLTPPERERVTRIYEAWASGGRLT
jgi:dihydrodipicolinate synthase/N-acetylneuraminate lyase